MNCTNDIKKDVKENRKGIKNFYICTDWSLINMIAKNKTIDQMPVWTLKWAPAFEILLSKQ